MSMLYVLGILCGAAVVLAVWLVCRALYAKQNGGPPQEYDERQQWVRGKAYQYGFWTVLVCVVVTGILREMLDVRLFDSQGGMRLLIWPGVLVFVIYCIWNGAYMRRNEKVVPTLFSIFLIAAANIACAVALCTKDHSFLQDGRLGSGSVNLMCAALMLAAAAAIMLRRLTLREESEEDS